AMLTVEAARARILETLQPLGAVPVPLPSAVGRVPATAILSAIDLPAFDNSALDGYAVRAEDVKGASAGNPIPLKQTGHVAAGMHSEAEVLPGNCVRLFTGSPLPKGADAVVMQEDCQVEK